MWCVCAYDSSNIVCFTTTDLDEVLCQDKDVQTILHRYAQSSSLEEIKHLLSVLPLSAVKRMLLMKDVWSECTPLHRASLNRHDGVLLEFVEFLYRNIAPLGEFCGVYV